MTGTANGGGGLGATEGTGTVMKNELEAGGIIPFEALSTTANVPWVDVGVPNNTAPMSCSQLGAASSDRLSGWSPLTLNAQRYCVLSIATSGQFAEIFGAPKIGREVGGRDGAKVSSEAGTAVLTASTTIVNCWWSFGAIPLLAVHRKGKEPGVVGTPTIMP